MSVTFKLPNGSLKQAEFEKNQRIEISERRSNDFGPDSEQISVPNIPSNLTIDDLMANTLKKFGKDDVLIYDAKRRNCQRFISDILTSNGLITSDISNFVNQNSTALFRKLGILDTIARNLTDLAAVGDKVIHGGNC